MEQKVKTSEEKVREIIAEVVKAQVPSFDNESLKTMIEETVTKAVATETEKAKRIEVEDNFEKDAKGGFKSFGHFCKDLYKTGASQGRNISKELDKWDSHVKAAGTGMNENTGEFGGFLVPEQFRRDLMVAVSETNDILPLCTSMPMESNIIKIPYVDGYDKSGGLVYGGIKWYWVAEESQATETRPKIDFMQMELHTLVGLFFASEQLLADSFTSVEALAKNGFRDGLNYVFNEVLLRGTGGGQPLGVYNAPCAVSITAETGQSSSSPIMFENVAKMYSRSTNPGKAVWVCNIALFPYLSSMSLTVGTGGVPVFMPAGGISGMPYPTLYGRPVLFNDHAATINTAGSMAFVDWSQYYIGTKSGADVTDYATSIHLKFDYLQTAFRFAVRMDGRPAWKQAYVPPVATTLTRSPIVLMPALT